MVIPANARYCVNLVLAFTICLHNEGNSMMLDLVCNCFRIIGECAVFIIDAIAFTAEIVVRTSG